MNNIQDNEISFPSAELLLAVIQKEYDYEIQRKTALETRSGILLAFTGVLLTFTVTNIRFTKIFEISSITPLIVAYLLVIGFFTITALISTVFTVANILKVLLTYKYNRLDLDDFKTERGTGSYPKDRVAMALVDEYKNIIELNHSNNNKKAMSYINAIKGLTVFASSVVILYLITLPL